MTTNTDINELARQLREAAQAAIKAPKMGNSTESKLAWAEEKVRYYELSKPEIVLAILDALEVAKYNVEIQEKIINHKDSLISLEKDYRERNFEALEAAQKQNTIPMQPIIRDKHGVCRFKANAIVEKLLDGGRIAGYDLNAITRDDYSDDDRMQLAQLIGYSVSGYGGLSYVSEESFNRASATPALRVRVND